MKIKPIKNDEDHMAAKEQIKQLLLADSSQSTRDVIDVLATLIETYERNTIVSKSPSPIEAIRFRMSQSGLTPKELEPFIGKRARVSEVLSGTRKLSIDMIRALHAGLGIPYEALLQKETPNTLEATDLSQPVIKKLADIGVELSSKNIGQFLMGAFGKSYSPTLNRKTRTQRASGKTDSTALLLWQAVVLSKARQETTIGDFDENDIDESFLADFAKLSGHPKGPLRAVNELSKKGITLVIVPLLPGTFLDGAIMLMDGVRPVIGLTIRHDRIDNFWFTLLHELSHLAEDLEVLKGANQVIFDELDLDSDDEIEKRADELAKVSLISPIHDQTLSNKYASTADIRSIGEEEGLHISIVAGRWQREHGNYKKFSKLIERNTVRDMLSIARR